MRNTTRALVLLMIIVVLASCGADEKAEPQMASATAEPQLAANGMVMAPYLTDLAQAKAQAAESGKKILVDFWADW